MTKEMDIIGTEMREWMDREACNVRGRVKLKREDVPTFHDWLKARLAATARDIEMMRRTLDAIKAIEPEQGTNDG